MVLEMVPCVAEELGSTPLVHLENCIRLWLVAHNHVGQMEE